MKSTFDFYNEETTKTAAESVVQLQGVLATYRKLLHPVNSLSADTTRTMAETVTTTKYILGLCLISAMALLLSRQWLYAAGTLIPAAVFYATYKSLAAKFAERLQEATKNTDDYYNAVAREQMLPVAAAASLRLCIYERNAVLFVDRENKEWTRRELIRVLNTTEGTETALQFLLSCAVFGWPEEGSPVKELTVEVLEKLRSVPVAELETAKDLPN